MADKAGDLGVQPRDRVCCWLRGARKRPRWGLRGWGWGAEPWILLLGNRKPSSGSPPILGVTVLLLMAGFDCLPGLTERSVSRPR